MGAVAVVWNRRVAQAILWSLAIASVVALGGCQAGLTHPSPTSTTGAAPRTTPVAADSAVDPTAGKPGTIAGVPSPRVVIPPKQRPVAPAQEPDVRVRIDEIGSAADRMGFNHPSGSLLVGSSGTQSSAKRLRTPIAVRLEEGSWIVAAQGAKELTWDASTPLTIKPIGAASGIVRYQGNDWPGSCELVAIADRGAQSVDVVMHLPMETYLPGVIAKELYGSWDDDAFEAQAIAARSYAVVETDRWKGRRHFDLVAGEASQAWVGATANPKALAAVRATRGQVLVFDDQVVPAYYSSCCGGRPANAADCVTDNPWHDITPLRAGDGAERTKCCGTAKVGRWSATMGAAAVAKAIEGFGKSSGRGELRELRAIRSIEPIERNRAGRVAEYRVTDSQGKVFTIGAEDLRRALASVQGGPLRSGDFRVQVGGGKCKFEGRGFGHGSGMCQHGAQTMALGGATESAILQRYYPSARIVTAWH